MGRSMSRSRRGGRARRTWRWLLFGALLVLSLAPAVLLTSLRLLQLDAGWAIRGVAFTPLATPLYAVGLVGVVVPVVTAARARDGLRSARWLLVAAVAGVLLFLHLSWLAPAYSGDVPEPSADGPRLRLLTANVLHGATSAKDVAELVERVDADVVVLQEVTVRWWRQARNGALGNSHRYVAGLPEPGGAAPGTVVMATRPLAGARDLPMVGDSLLVAVHLGERTVELLAAHPRYPVRPEAWLYDHDLLAGTVKERRPAVLVGDFNATVDHAQLQRLRDLGYRSADELLNSGWAPTWPDHGTRSVWGVPLPRLVQLDHVLVRPSLTATGVEHLELPGSDHRAVAAEVAPR